MTIFKADSQPGDVKNPETVERAIEPAADNPDLQPQQQGELKAEGAADRQDGGDEPRERKPGGIDRAAIGRKFAKNRAESSEDIPFDGNFGREQVLAGRLTQEQAEPEPPPEGGTEQHQQQPQARASGPSDSQAPQKFTLTVYDEPIEMEIGRVAELAGLTVDEVKASPTAAVRIAQREIASQKRLDEAKKFGRDTRETSARRDHTGEGQNQPDAADHGNPDAETVENQDDLRSVVEKIQFGTPDEGAEALRTVIDQARSNGASPEEIRKEVYMHQRQLDVGRAKTAYDDFLAKPENAVLVKDPNAHAVMENLYYSEVAADLRKLGMSEDQIPTSDRERLVEIHRFHRINGARVRETAALLDASKQGFETWKKGGQGQTTPNPPPQNRREIEVRLDRSDRRAGIPSQPARAAVPPPSTTPRPAPSSRSAAVAKMLKGRGRAIVT